MSRALRDETQPDMEGEEAPPPIDQPLIMGENQLPLSPAQQRTAVELVMSDFESAKQARDSRDLGWDSKGAKQSFDTWLVELKRLYFGQREPKTVPWKFCSNRSMMIAMAIVETLHARALPAIVNEDLTRWRPGDATDAEKVKRIEDFMYWWIRVRSRMREFFDRWVRYCIAMPFVVTESVLDVEMRDTGLTQAPPSIPGPDGMPIQAPPERILKPYERTRSDIYPIEDVFFQPGATDIQRDPVILRARYVYRDLEDMEKNGEAVNVETASDPSVMTLLDSIGVDVVAAEGMDEQGLAELRRVKARNKPVQVLKWYGNFDMDNDGYAEPIILMVDPEHRLYLGGMELSKVSARGLRPLDVTSYMTRLDEPQGLWGMGVLEQVKELANELDAIFNQMTDANTLSVLRPGFYDPNGDLDAGALEIAPNKMTPVSRPNESVFFPQFDIPTERLLNAIRLVLEFIERVTAASSYILGKESEVVGGSGTATRTEAIVGAANQRHAIPVARMREGACRILTIHLDILQKRMPADLEQRVLGPSHEPIFGPNELTQEGIAGEFDAYLLPDESMGSKETERQLSQMLWQTVGQSLIVQSDPIKQYTFLADILRANGKQPDKYLGPQPDLSMLTTPDQEHTMLLQGEFSKVQATMTQNPIEHIMAHQAFLQDPGFTQLPPQIQQQVGTALQMHIQQHMQIMSTIATMSKAGGGKSPSGEPGGTEDGGNDVGGAPGGNGAPSNGVGPEPGVGSVRSPLAQAQQIKRGGESRGAQVGGLRQG